jgi:hypothetical protein
MLLKRFVCQLAYGSFLFFQLRNYRLRNYNWAENEGIVGFKNDNAFTFLKGEGTL